MHYTFQVTCPTLSKTLEVRLNKVVNAHILLFLIRRSKMFLECVLLVNSDNVFWLFISVHPYLSANLIPISELP